MKKAGRMDKFKHYPESIIQQEEFEEDEEDGPEMMYSMADQRIFSRNQRPVYVGNASS